LERRLREEDFMPDQIAPEYKEADRRSGPNQENTERARAGVTGHNVRYVLSFGLLAVIIAFAIVYLIYLLLPREGDARVAWDVLNDYFGI
jgi:hypothetical protein